MLAPGSIRISPVAVDHLVIPTVWIRQIKSRFLMSAIPPAQMHGVVRPYPGHIVDPSFGERFCYVLWRIPGAAVNRFSTEPKHGAGISHRKVVLKTLGFACNRGP